jgi:hypothetical protein
MNIPCGVVLDNFAIPQGFAVIKPQPRPQPHRTEHLVGFPRPPTGQGLAVRVHGSVHAEGQWQVRRSAAEVGLGEARDVALRQDAENNVA